MGDPRYADSVCQPTGVCHGAEKTSITDPAELERLGFSLVSWEYPAPIGVRIQLKSPVGGGTFSLTFTPDQRKILSEFLKEEGF